MFRNSIATGFNRTKQRPGLVFLLFGINLLFALLLSLPVYIILGNAVNISGFGPDLAEYFDLVLWMDLWETIGPSFISLVRQLIWMIPLYIVGKAAIGVGLAHALSGINGRSFWQGVGDFTGKGVLVGLMFLPLMIGVILVSIFAAVILGMVWTGEVGVFWVNFVIAPVFAVLGLMLVDLMQDYARIAIVLDHSKIFRAWITGLTWPLKHSTSYWIYLIWFVVAAVLVGLPTLLELSFVAATGVTIWGLFVLQQAVLLLRAAVTVSWIGSGVAFFESVRHQEAPLIAEETVETMEAEGDEQVTPSSETLSNGFAPV